MSEGRNVNHIEKNLGFLALRGSSVRRLEPALAVTQKGEVASEENSRGSQETQAGAKPTRGIKRLN
jgi:hypothetical protein